MRSPIAAQKWLSFPASLSEPSGTRAPHHLKLFVNESKPCQSLGMCSIHYPKQMIRVDTEAQSSPKVKVGCTFSRETWAAEANDAVRLPASMTRLRPTACSILY